MKHRQLSEALAAHEIDLKPEECHALIVGCLCVEPNRVDFAEIGTSLNQIEDWRAYADKIQYIIEELWSVVHQSLREGDFGFTLLLPPNSTHSLDEQAAALADWAGAFLIGLSLTTSQHSFAEQKLSEDSLQFLAHLSRYVDLGHIASLEDNLEDNEQNHEDLFELIEYCRMGVIGVYLDLNRNLVTH